jgi:hypothetical protein
VFILRPAAFELDPTREHWTITEVARVPVGYGTPSATTEVPLYRVEPPAGCPG